MANLAAVANEDSPGVHDTIVMRTFESEDLNGRPLVLPRDLPGERTLVLAAFKREQQRDVDTWIDGLELKASNLPWIELPVIRNWGWLWRSYVDNGMRSGITQPDDRARVVTVYTDPESFLAAMGLPAADQIYALIIDRQGRVLARFDGPFSADRADAVRGLLSGGG